MSLAISRESFEELKNYLGVSFQQGRPILDADLNEAQAIALSLLRRFSREALGDGSPNKGFTIDAVYPPPPELLLDDLDLEGMTLEEAIAAIAAVCVVDLLSLALYLMFGPILFFLTIPGKELEAFESIGGFTLSSPQGSLRIGRDRPYRGGGFVRLSGHPGTVTVIKTLPSLRDLSAFELATFRYRQNRQSPGVFKFFLEDDDGNRSVWLCGNPAFAADTWLAGVVAPLDIRFRIVSTSVPVAAVGQSYNASLITYAGTTPMTWSISGTNLPAGLTVEPAGSGDDSRKGRLEFAPTAAGIIAFTVTVVDADQRSTSRDFTLTVKQPPVPPTLPLPTGAEVLSQLGRSEAPTGTPADLTAVRRYGFELYQDAAEPLVWDLDDLRLGSTALEEAAASNNFVIRGSEVTQLLNQLTLVNMLVSSDSGGPGGGGAGGAPDPQLQALLDLLNTELLLAESTLDNAGRFYLSGLPCVQITDVLYADQADPNDPPLTPPPSGQVRRDTVYLDAWTEPVTYVQDPAIREVALGGPDTTTRERLHQRVRVAQGGETPTGNGMGFGTLATEGTYTARANRLYRVEIDTAGSIGTATFRWSNENAATVARIIEPVPPGSKLLVVEDASAFHPGDLVLVRKEFGAEEHVVHQVFANEIVLDSATGTQLGSLPAAGRVPDFTTFALADRPMVQRWDGFGVPVTADPADATISAAMLLDDGVRVRFGGHGMRAGDFWTFTTRYLAGDEATGIDPVTRIERLDFARPRGVRHHYATLAVLTRDGDAVDPAKIFKVEDRRMRVGGSATLGAQLRDVTALAGTDAVHLGGVRLPAGARDSKLLVFWSGDLYLPDPIPPRQPGGDIRSTLTVRVSFYGDAMTDPAVQPDEGKIQDRDQRVVLTRRPVGVDLPLHLMFVKSDLSATFLPMTTIPTSVQVFASLDRDDVTVELTGMQLTILELKKSF